MAGSNIAVFEIYLNRQNVEEAVEALQEAVSSRSTDISGL